MRVLDAEAITTWAASCVRELDVLHIEIDRLNVYPVPDSDTGSNLLYTMKGAHAALDGAALDGAGQALAVLARGAVAAARGNSGVIASQLLRGVAQACTDAEVVDAALLAAALARAEAVATQAVAHPVEGTMLTVLRAAASAAERASTDGAPVEVVAGAAATEAAAALADTPKQLAVLAEAGVVDAGGRGVLLMLDQLVGVLTGEPAPGRPEFAAPAQRPRSLQAQSGSEEQPWEVMYMLEGVSERSATSLRDSLSVIGDCVTIAGDDDGRHAVHVHCGDIGAALEAGLGVGRPYQIRVESLVRVQLMEHGPFAERAVVAVVTGDELAELCRHEGITVLQVADGTPPSVDLVERAIRDAASVHVTVLPGSADLTTVADEAAERVVAGGRDVVVVPCASPVQVLAALAVHDATRRAGDDVVAMAEAAAATRRGELAIAEQDAITWVGRVNAGDLVGFLDDEVVLIESAEKLYGPTANERDVLVDAAMAVLGRMLAAGGELVTILLGAAAPEGIEDSLAERLADGHPEVDVMAYPGGQTESVMTFGLE